MIGSFFAGLNETCAGWSGEAVFLRLLLATIAGTVVGLEREYRNKGAGIKTHVLVCLGSALSIVVGEYALRHFAGADVDVTRIGAQVISGVGFLGVGTIIVTHNNEVRGLTTAAGLWVSACVGLAAGIGYMEGTLMALGFMLVTFTLLSRLDHLLRRMSKTFDLYIEFDDRSGVTEFLKKIHAWDCSYSNFNLSKGKAGGPGMAVTVTITLDSLGRKENFITSIQMLDFVTFCDEI